MKRVGRIVATGLFALLGIPSALADSATRSWTGCYAGLHTGGLWGMVDHKVTGVLVDASYQSNVNFQSPTAGAHAGCNYQTGTLVLGIEGDLNWTSVDDSVVAYSNEDTGRRQLWHDTLDWFATLRGRIGVANGAWHAYATGGLAFSDLKLGFEDYRFGAIEAKFASNSTHGWVAGGGIEYMLQPQWIARIEYLYHRFDSQLILVDGGVSFFRGDQPHFHILRAGITRRFGM